MAWRQVTDDHTDMIISPQIARQGKLLRFLRSASLHFLAAFLPIFSTDPDPKTIDFKLKPAPIKIVPLHVLPHSTCLIYISHIKVPL